MITEDKLAAAAVAQIFGSELLKVQKNAVTDSGAQPSIVNIDPKQFLVSGPDPRGISMRKSAEHRKMMEVLQREAESAHPLPTPEQTNPESYSKDPVKISNLEQLLLKQHEVLEKIEKHLQNIASFVEKNTKSVKIKQ